MSTAHILLAVLAALAAFFAWRWLRAERGTTRAAANPGPLRLAIGFVTNFFDTLGIGSFAHDHRDRSSSAVSCPIELIPGTLNVGHTMPTMAQAFIFIGIVQVESLTLVS